VSEPKRVSLVSLTASRLGTPGCSSDFTAEELLVYIARVSNPENQGKFETSAKLIAYLIRQKHWSPFEMVDLTVEINTSRAIAAQILRHRSFSFQEFSQRYAKATDYVRYDARRQAEKNRQDSVDDLPEHTRGWFDDAQSLVWDRSFGLYEEALKKGIAKECARFLLPLNTETRLYMKGSLRSWLHYLQVRTDVHAQKEHRDIANDIRAIFAENFPATTEALGWNAND
jgi:thymidylate synthase (FAD)